MPSQVYSARLPPSFFFPPLHDIHLPGSADGRWPVFDVLPTSLLVLVACQVSDWHRRSINAPSSRVSAAISFLFSFPFFFAFSMPFHRISPTAASSHIYFARAKPCARPSYDLTCAALHRLCYNAVSKSQSERRPKAKRQKRPNAQQTPRVQQSIRQSIRLFCAVQQRPAQPGGRAAR
ncbi:hypothetical protein BKA80DRAFT_88903 [Phyllosticta citrichinensis]